MNFNPLLSGAINFLMFLIIYSGLSLYLSDLFYEALQTQSYRLHHP